MLIRHARPADAERLSALAMRTFIDTFGGDNRPEDMALHCRLSYSPARQRKEIDNPGWTTLVCEESGELVGYAQLRQEEFPPCVGSDSAGEILCFYLDKAWHGRGLAHRLMVACLDAFRRKGVEVVWLGVWERNPRAIAFYAREGFREVGEHIFQLGDDPQRDIILTRRPD